MLISVYFQCTADRFDTFLLLTSSDLDECDPSNAAEDEEGLRCQQICHNYVGGYFCSCRPGYQLQSDYHSCKGKLKV